MNEDEVRALLAVAMGYDNRRPGDLNVAAWREASERGRWTLGEAVNAAHEHYAVSSDFLMPAHITDRIKAERRHAPLPAERQIEMAPPAEVSRIRQVVQEVADQLGWSQRTTAKSDPELKVRCPHDPCQAGIGRPCGRRVVRKGPHQGEWHPLAGYHPSRTQAVVRIREAQEKPE